MGKQLKLEAWLPKTSISSASRISTLEELERAHIIEVLKLACERRKRRSKGLGLKTHYIGSTDEKVGD